MLLDEKLEFSRVVEAEVGVEKYFDGQYESFSLSFSNSSSAIILKIKFILHAYLLLI